MARYISHGKEESGQTSGEDDRSSSEESMRKNKEARNSTEAQRMTINLECLGLCGQSMWGIEKTANGQVGGPRCYTKKLELFPGSTKEILEAEESGDWIMNF